MFQWTGLNCTHYICNIINTIKGYHTFTLRTLIAKRNQSFEISSIVFVSIDLNLSYEIYMLLQTVNVCTAWSTVHAQADFCTHYSTLK